jgi:IstB-like ATP binding protein
LPLANCSSSITWLCTALTNPRWNSLGVFGQRHERSSIILTSNLLFKEWTGTFGSRCLAGPLLDRLTDHAHILEINGENYIGSNNQKSARGAASHQPNHKSGKTASAS